MSHRLDGYLPPQTAASTNGASTAIGSQSAIGINSAGGDIILKTGTGTSYDGYIYMYTGNTLKGLIAPAFTAFVAPLIDFLVPIIAIDGGQANPKFYQFDQPAAGVDGSFLTIQSQSSTTFPARGGDLILASGDGYEFGTTIQDGYVRLQTGSGRDVFTLDGTNASFFARYGSYGSGQNVIYINNATTAPTTGPTSGGLFYSQGGDAFWWTPNNLVQSVSSTRIVRQIPSDANYTAVQADYQAKIMEFTSVTLTGTRDVVVPLNSGYQWTVFNNTTGAQSLQFIGISGTGVTVANGKRAIIYADGTNIVRVTPDT